MNYLKNNLNEIRKDEPSIIERIVRDEQPIAQRTERTITVDSSSYSLFLTDESLMSDSEDENAHKVTKDILSTLDMLALVYEDADELDTILSTATGVMGYTARYWAGFYPLLLLNISHKPDQPSVPEGNTEQIFSQFSSVHHLILHDWEQQADDVLECMVRYKVHLEKCGKREKEQGKRDRLSRDWKCPSQCGLVSDSHLNTKEQKGKRTFFQVVKKNISARKFIKSN